MTIRYIMGGLSTFIPQFNHYLANGTGGTDTARYCYSVWLRHLVMAKKNGLNCFPKVIAELGPGDSLGIGLAALVSGCDKYYAFDVVEHATIERNLKIFDEIINLFREKVDIPSDEEFPKIKPALESYVFPREILNDNRLIYALDNSRLEKIRDSLRNPKKIDSIVEYKVPWLDPYVIHKETVDMIYSQAVLEHVDDLINTYKAMYVWLKPDGYISHQIDFKCHGTASEWNGHWKYSELIWKLIRGKRPYFINREPFSKHLSMMKDHGFETVFEKRHKSLSTLRISDLSSDYRSISIDDLVTSSAFVQAVKKILKGHQ